jgi:hypothetical protein
VVVESRRDGTAVLLVVVMVPAIHSDDEDEDEAAVEVRMVVLLAVVGAAMMSVVVALLPSHSEGEDEEKLTTANVGDGTVVLTLCSATALDNASVLEFHAVSMLTSQSKEYRSDSEMKLWN